jgi:hypothetical protein
VGVATLDPALADSVRRYEGALIRFHDVLQGLGEVDAHRTPGKGWSVAQCLDHLVVSGTLMVARLEESIQRARELTRLARSPKPARFGWFDRLFVAAVSRGKGGGPPRFRVGHRPQFDPGTGRAIPILESEFIALEDRLINCARSANGLDLAGYKVPSVLDDRIQVGLGAWFVAIAAHQERHLDQAARIRKELGR